MIDIKSATEEERKEEYARIAKEIGDDMFFTKKELNSLPEILVSGEQVLAFSSGIMNGNTWLITLTDKRIIFLDKGMIYGLRQVFIPISKINALSGEMGAVFGKIAINDGYTERVIKNVPKKTVQPFMNKLQEVILAAAV